MTSRFLHLSSPILIYTLTSVLTLSGCSSAAKSSAAKAEQKTVAAIDEHTASALQRAQKAEEKKITVAPKENASTEDAAHNATEPGPAIVKPPVKTEPAPGSGDHAAAKNENETAGAAATSPAASHGGHEAAPVVSGEQSLKWLVNGNVRFLKKYFRADGRGAQDRKRLYAGQHPHAIVLSCSDSRVPPEIVFDQALGEIFVIRVAGEALDSSVIASVEYAVEHLGPRLLVVMGHTKCGAVDAAINVKEGSSAGSADLDRLLAEIRPHLKTVAKETPSKDIEVESALNADGVARDLVKRSEIIRKKVDAGELLIKSALYRMDSGKVNFY
jgi:carbonic anhydrase